MPVLFIFGFISIWMINWKAECKYFAFLQYYFLPGSPLPPLNSFIWTSIQLTKLNFKFKGCFYQLSQEIWSDRKKDGQSFNFYMQAASLLLLLTKPSLSSFQMCSMGLHLHVLFDLFLVRVSSLQACRSIGEKKI